MILKVFTLYPFLSGYGIEIAEVPVTLQAHMYQCTSSYSTTQSCKRIRLRFLAMEDIAEDEKTKLDDIFSNFVAKFNLSMTLRETEAMYQRHKLVSSFDDHG